MAMKQPQIKTKHKLTTLAVILVVVTNLFLFNFLIAPSASAQGAPAAASAAASGAAAATGAVSVISLPQQAWNITKNALDTISDTLFVNIVGGLSNMVAAQAGTWAGTGGHGEAPLFWREPGKYISRGLDAAGAEWARQIVKDVTGGLDICALDDFSIDILLQMPLFPDSVYDYDPDCTFTTIRNDIEDLEQRIDKMIGGEFGIGMDSDFADKINKTYDQIKQEQRFQIWDARLEEYEENALRECSYQEPSSVTNPTFQDLDSVPEENEGNKMICAQPIIKKLLEQQADYVRGMSQLIEADARLMLTNVARARQPGVEPVQLSRFNNEPLGTWRIAPETIPAIRSAWLNRIRSYSYEINQLLNTYNNCRFITAEQLRTRPGNCEQVLRDLSVVAVPLANQLPPEEQESIPEIFENEYQTKVALAIVYANSIKDGYETLIETIEENFQPEFFNLTFNYSTDEARQSLSPQANMLLAYNKMELGIQKQGLDEYLDRQFETDLGDGWKSVTSSIADTVLTPANMIREDLQKRLESKSISESQYFRGNVLATSVEIFGKAFWNELIRQMLAGLFKGTQEEYYVSDFFVDQSTGASVLDQENPYEEEVIPLEGVEYYIERLTEKYSYSLILQDLNLLSDFQLNLTGKVNPNLYNNVLDSNLGLAVNEKMSIAEAIESGRLIGDYRFSWGERVEPGTYHLANIKKLRKGRVVPLGLELAIELIRDCNYRKNAGEEFALFNDLNEQNKYGYDNPENPYKTQKLKNCLFRPFVDSAEDDDEEGTGIDQVRDYNVRKMNEVINATLADVVNGFDQYGSGTCGNFDDNESAFCNLVNPEWILKIPPSKCALQIDNEPYNELLVTNQTGQRYAACPDFVSCLNEDGKGGCVGGDYGVCVKEENVWQFGADLCPAEFNSCRTYTLTGARGSNQVSYLQNTLSGNDICGPFNAGCSWYATRQINDFWIDFSQLDSFECTDPAVKGVWVEGQGCRAERLYLNRYVEQCDRQQEGCNEFMLFGDSQTNLIGNSGFEYTEEGLFPQGWDLRLKKLVADQSECDDTYYETCYLDDEYNNDLAENDCLDSGGDYRRLCLSSVLKYGLCYSPQFTDEAGLTAEEQCTANQGTWVEECQIEGEVRTEFSDPAECGDLPAGSPADANPCEVACQNNGGSWNTYCQGAVLYASDSNDNPQNTFDCQEVLGTWRGEGPFSDIASVSKNGQFVQSGLSKLQIDIGGLAADEELQLVKSLSFADDAEILVRGGEAYTASAYIMANQNLTEPLGINLIKTYIGADEEINSSEIFLGQSYSRASTPLLTSNIGTELELLIRLPGGQSGAMVYLDSVSLNNNTVQQLRNFDFLTGYQDYESNNKFYYKRPPEYWNCYGYGPGDPAPVLPVQPLTKLNCENNGGYYDEDLVYRDTTACYQYAPDNAACNNFLKVCQADEVGCQSYQPVEGGPAIPGVVSPTDYCPAECVGYDTYKQEPALYEPAPSPLYHYFIPETARQCTFREVGCSQFTNLDEVARGGEGIEYYTYLRQCIKPGQGLGEKDYFSWQSSASGPPQIINYEFQEDPITGAPKTIDNEGDCRLTIGEEDLNCVEFFDSQGDEYYRDIRKTISVSEDCHPYRKTESTEANCSATNGRWQADINSCVYDAIPSEGIACRAEADGCRAFIGNQGNNVYVQVFDNFENASLDWYSGTSGQGTGLTLVGESVQLGGHSLFVSEAYESINKEVEIRKGNLYVLSFWAKGNQGETISVKFDKAPLQGDGDDSTIEEFASLDPGKVDLAPPVTLSNEWRNYNLGPVYISDQWGDISDNRLVFDSLGGQVYLDNITLKVVKDNVYVVKNTWSTPDSCNRNIYGLVDPNNPRPMLGCKAYDDSFNNRHNLRSFTNLCRESVIGCEILINTQNSTNANQVLYNGNNQTLLDDHVVPADQLETYVINEEYLCTAADKGCQRLGQPLFDLSTGSNNVNFEDILLKNNPDKYTEVANSIMCNHDALGCTELVTPNGSSEYYKIEPTKLCSFTENIVNDNSVKGWFRKGNNFLGCGSLNYNSATICQQNGGGWSELYQQCTVILQDISDQESCELQNGEWLNSQCLAWPFNIYKVYEANKYKGYVGECPGQYNGCTEFVDVNPNFVGNGGFEVLVDNRLANWTVVNGASGRQDIETAEVREGNQAIRLTKLTEKDFPVTFVSRPNEAEPYGIKQKVVRLERGRTYKASFYYNVPAEAQGQGEGCPLPEASVSFDRLTEDNNIVAGDVYSYPPENGWKKVEVLFTVPWGICDNASLTEQVACESAGATWEILPELQDYQLTLYAPLNTNTQGENNCPNSYVLYDQFEIKDNTEDSYYVIDLGSSVNRRACTAVDWNRGCVQFLNTINDDFEILQVERDRECAEWAYCASRDANDYCTDVELCTDESGGECIQQSVKKDNVRYNLDQEPLVVQRISDYETKSGYIYRFGSGELSNLSMWRAGDYSGYTLSYRYPLETELDFSNGFTQFEMINNLDSDQGISLKEDQRYTDPICKVFPDEDAPIPYQLSEQQDYRNIAKYFAPGTDLNELGNMCNYKEVKTETVTTYYPESIQIDDTDSLCSESADDKKGGFPSEVACDPTKTEQVDTVKNINGLESMCLEFSTLNPVYNGIYKDFKKDCSETDGEETCVGPDYQPYSCLTYYPFYIDISQY